MKIDEILEAIDTGLQTAGDTAYGSDRTGACWRCRHTSETDLCDTCRADLLDEPTEPTPAERKAAFVTVLIHVDIEPLRAALDGLLAAFNRRPPAVQRQILQIEQLNNRSLTT